MTTHTAARALIDYLFGSPERDRLAGALSETWIDLDSELQKVGRGALTEPWARTAYRHLMQSETYLASWDLHQGWMSLAAAKRAMLSSPRDPELVARVATLLFHENEKLSGRRAKAVKDLICDEQGDLLQTLSKTPERVIDAVAIRDDQYQTTYFKILLRRRHLFQLFLVLLVAIVALVVFSWFGELPAPYDDAKGVLIVILFGVLGASLSVGQGLLATDLSAKIPMQQIGAFVVWMRPAIGAATALVALAVLHANDTFKFFGWDTSVPGVVVAVAFAAGYSERFILGALERISDGGGG